MYGVNTNDKIYCRRGITSQKPYGNDWREVEGRLKYISCGALGCWGVNSADYIYFRVGVTPQNCEGQSWALISGKLKQIEVSDIVNSLGKFV